MGFDRSTYWFINQVTIFKMTRNQLSDTTEGGVEPALNGDRESRGQPRFHTETLLDGRRELAPAGFGG